MPGSRPASSNAAHHPPVPGPSPCRKPGWGGSGGEVTMSTRTACWYSRSAVSYAASPGRTSRSIRFRSVKRPLPRDVSASISGCLAHGRRRRSFAPPFELLDGLRQSLRQIRDQVGGSGEPDANSILDQLVSAWLSPGHGSENPRSPPRTRDRPIRRCLEFIEDSDWSALSPSGFYEIARVSERTLQQGFRERFGLTLAAFLKARRLATVRRRLLEADHGEVTVGAELAALGFWHVGQFAADYRRAFGETPFATLNRARNG